MKYETSENTNNRNGQHKIDTKQERLLNKRTEFISKCCH